MIELHHIDCLSHMRSMPDNCVDAIVTDPPYGLSFMGKKWDYDVPSVEIWAECLRVLKPGGHLLAFAGTRTQHRMAVRIEDAGFEIRDMIAWVYGSGFPKSHDVSKAIDKAAGAEREVIGEGTTTGARKASAFDDGKGYTTGRTFQNEVPVVNMITAPASEPAKQWQGWGTALKPALEPITMARKPLIGTVAQNVMEHGTGAINVDACRVGTSDKLGGGNEKAETSAKFTNEGWKRPWMKDADALEHQAAKVRAKVDKAEAMGRWPANLIHDGSDEVMVVFPETGASSDRPRNNKASMGYGGSKVDFRTEGHSDSGGSAARFFYCAKASRSERGSDNVHPTVKPVALMRYLVRLVTPPGGTVMDPFSGSGTTGMACKLEGFNYIGTDREAEYIEISRARIDNCQPEEEEDANQLTLFDAPKPTAQQLTIEG